MTQNNNLSVLPFYTNIEQQNHRKNYAFGAIYPLYSPINKLLPFQIIRSTRTNTITSIRLYDKNGVYVSNLTNQVKNSGLSIVAFADYDIIVYTGNQTMSANMQEGQYYIVMTDGVQTWYSEIFTVVRDMSPYLKIEWYDNEDLVFDSGRILYINPNFKNNLYLCTELGKPDYEFVEEGDNRDGYFFAEKQISEKTYKFTALAPEYLCDVMRLIRMSDNIIITDKYGQIYKCDTFLITPKWQTQGDLASIEVEFTTNTVVKKLALGYVRAKIIGDFNNDFNDDYNN